MARSIRSVLQAYDRDPGLFLLGGGALLVAVLWHLPVPPFLFAEGESGGSGGSAACKCSLPSKACESWEDDLSPSNPKCGTRPPAGWEFCESKDHTRDCPQWPGQTQKMIDGLFYYEKGTSPWNTAKCTHPAPPGGGDVLDTCLFALKRTVKTARVGTGDNTRTITFTPRTKIEFKNFDESNVRNPGQTALKINFVSAVFASMNVCGEEITDPNFPDADDQAQGHTGPVGWDYMEHEFSHGGDPAQWRLTPASPFQTQFHALTKACPCTATNDDPVEKVKFVCHVKDNTGVQLGAAAEDKTAYLKCYIADDTTTCEPAG